MTDQASCSACPRNCHINRKSGLGFCSKASEIKISWYGPHFGEEPPITGNKGSGTIFFSGCNLKCVYCQNWQISQENINTDKVSGKQLVNILLNLQKQGVHNINLVSPSVWSLQLIKVLKTAKDKGLRIPVIWNSNAYEKVTVLKKLRGLIDIYLPDYKYTDKDLGLRYSDVPDYALVAQKAILEMYRQVGDLKKDKQGIAERGLIVRHLILPGLIDNSLSCLKFIRRISPNIHLSVMSQYNPVYKAVKIKDLKRKVNKEEYKEVKTLVNKLKFKNGWFQEYDSQDCFNPDFSKTNPFVTSC